MDFFDTLRVKITLFRLRRRAAPRAEFRRALLARLEGHPVGLLDQVRGLFLTRLMAPVGVLVLSLVATGTYAYTSPNVAAGHPLYRFKRKFEGYEEQMNRSPERQASFYVRKAERRAAEALSLARDEQSSSEVSFASAIEELQRSVATLNRIPDAAKRRRAVRVILQGDGTYLIKIQEASVENPAVLRALARTAAANRDDLRAGVQALQDPELRELLRAHLLAREALLGGVNGE